MCSPEVLTAAEQILLVDHAVPGSWGLLKSLCLVMAELPCQTSCDGVGGHGDSSRYVLWYEQWIQEEQHKFSSSCSSYAGVDVGTSCYTVTEAEIFLGWDEFWYSRAQRIPAALGKGPAPNGCFPKPASHVMLLSDHPWAALWLLQIYSLIA